MNKPALLKLAQLLRKPLPKGVDRFEMKWWREKSECGTAACACGLAASDPWFIKRGFRLKTDIFTWPTVYPIYRSRTHFEAAEQFFGISTTQVMHLFFHDSYKRGSKFDVARRIEGFVRRGKV